MVVIPAESSSPEMEHMADLVTEDLVDTDIPAQPVAPLLLSYGAPFVTCHIACEI